MIVGEDVAARLSGTTPTVPRSPPGPRSPTTTRWARAMGGDPSTSVVDVGLRVHGLEGVAVVDASVIPAVTTGPVHAAVPANAEGGADPRS